MVFNCRKPTKIITIKLRIFYSISLSKIEKITSDKMNNIRCHMTIDLIYMFYRLGSILTNLYNLSNVCFIVDQKFILHIHYTTYSRLLVYSFSLSLFFFLSSLYMDDTVNIFDQHLH